MWKPPDVKQLAALWKKHRWLLLLLAAGLLLLRWPSTAAPAQKTTPLVPETGEYAFDLSAYEAKLTATLSSVSGAGRLRVMLSLKSGTETVYATEGRAEKREGLTENEETSLVQIGQSPVVVKRLYPAFAGAVVVCDGAGSALVQLEITKAVAALTGLGADKIAVLPMK